MLFVKGRFDGGRGLRFGFMLQGKTQKKSVSFSTELTLPCRYVALRDILIYHVGYEAFYDELTHIYNYAVRENLKLYYSSAPLSATGR